jgi:hypothetical protein
MNFSKTCVYHMSTIIVVEHQYHLLCFLSVLFVSIRILMRAIQPYVRNLMLENVEANQIENNKVFQCWIIYSEAPRYRLPRGSS